MKNLDKYLNYLRNQRNKDLIVDHFPGLESYYLNKEFSDITLIIDNQKRFAHKFVLLKSPFFAQYLSENNVKEIVVKQGFTVKAIELILKFLYFEKFSFNDINNDYKLLKQVLDLSEEYQLIRLKITIKDLMVDQLTRNGSQLDIDSKLDNYRLVVEMGWNRFKTFYLDICRQQIGFETFEKYLNYGLDNSLDQLLEISIEFIDNSVTIDSDWFCHLPIPIIRFVNKYSNNCQNNISKAIHRIKKLNPNENMDQLEKDLNIE